MAASTFEVEKTSLDMLKALVDENLASVSHLVMGGWCTTAYIGNVRFTTDIDILCKPFTQRSVVKKFDERNFFVREVFYGVQARHKRTGIEVHINTDAYVHDRSTGSKISVPEGIFKRPRMMSVSGIMYAKKVTVPVTPLEYFMVLKSIPDRDKDDFDFAVLLAKQKFDAKEFARLLRTCASSLKPFLEKQKRLRSRKMFISLERRVAGGEILDVSSYRRMLMRLDEISDKIEI